MTNEEVEAMHPLDVMDQASLVERRLGPGELGRVVSEVLEIHVYSMSCCLLAGLPVSEVVTTNYNQMFELASRSIGVETAVLPYHPAAGRARWLLKMHGCVEHYEDLVLTREQYIRYESTRSALSGIVQSLLVLRHLLFAGFSLADSNFFRIVDDVRRALQHAPEPQEAEIGKTSSVKKNLLGDLSGTVRRSSSSPALRSIEEAQTVSEEQQSTEESSEEETAPRGEEAVQFGSALSLTETPLMSIWRQTLSVISMTKSMSAPPFSKQPRSNEEASFTAKAARRFEIFLDALSSFSAATTTFLMQHEYDGLITDDQRALRAELEKFNESMSDEAKRAPEYELFQQMMRRLGSSHGASQVDESSFIEPGRWTT